MTVLSSLGQLPDPLGDDGFADKGVVDDGTAVNRRPRFILLEGRELL